MGISKRLWQKLNYQRYGPVKWPSKPGKEKVWDRFRLKPEEQIQVSFANWLDKRGVLYTASCAGMRTSIKTGKRMKMMGAKKGFPDIQIFDWHPTFRGLLIELKAKRGHVSKWQEEWRDSLIKQGYKALIMPCNLDYDPAMDWLTFHVNNYLEGR